MVIVYHRSEGGPSLGSLATLVPNVETVQRVVVVVGEIIEMHHLQHFGLIVGS